MFLKGFKSKYYETVIFAKSSSYIWKFLEIGTEFYMAIPLTQCTVVLKFPSGFDQKKNSICYLLVGKGLLHPNPNFHQSVNWGDNMWYFLIILKIHKKCHIGVVVVVALFCFLFCFCCCCFYVLFCFCFWIFGLSCSPLRHFPSVFYFFLPIAVTSYKHCVNILAGYTSVLGVIGWVVGNLFT